MQEVVELRLVGRLDASWAGFVLTAIEDEVRGGHHHIELDMALVDYLSSAGIRVVVKFFVNCRASVVRCGSQMQVPVRRRSCRWRA